MSQASSSTKERTEALAESLKPLLGNKAIIIVSDNTVFVRPKDYSSCGGFGRKKTSYHLSYLCDPRWESINIPTGVSMHIQYFAYSMNEDNSPGNDPWCVDWFNKKFGSKVIISDLDNVYSTNTAYTE